jgi:hypothetical protein
MMNDLFETTISCPYCGEEINVLIEPLEEEQEYIEDCQVCCRPIVFHISLQSDGSYTVSVHSENDTY